MFSSIFIQEALSSPRTHFIFQETPMPRGIFQEFSAEQIFR